jgi:RNA polymerase sigma factor (sigma-70 family)
LFRNDPEMLAAFREGRREALEHVYRANIESIIRYVRALARAHGRRDLAQSGATSDLVQEIFLRAFSQSTRASYDCSREFGPYLKAVARNHLIDTLRSGRREDLKTPDELALLIDRESSSGTPSGDPEMLAIVESYLRDLPANLEAVYQQRFVLERSQEAASHALALSRRTIRTAERHLLRGLRQSLARRGQIVGRAHDNVSGRSQARLTTGNAWVR